MSDYWGFHGIYNCSGCDIASISSRETIYNFTKELVDKIDMIAYGEPIIEHFAEHDPTKAGYTMLQMIQTSNLSAHFVESNGEAYIDVFSCKNFDSAVVEEIIVKYFKATQIQSARILRSAEKLALAIG